MAYIFVNVNRSVGTINPNIYGQFSEHLGRCIYQGIYVGQASDIPNTNGMRNDVVSALKALHVPVLRWPGGCFADTYHWRDGIGPKENRKTIVNTNWGGVTEDNSFGTHEFMELCRQIGCEAYFSGNVGSGTVQEFSDWVEYCNMGGISPMASERRANGQDEPFNVKYWGIGNEAWGCGGSMRAEYYADLCRQYSTYLRNYSPEHKIFKIASGANVADYHWTKTVMERAGAGCPRGTEHQPDGGRLYRHPAAVQRSRFCGEPVMEAQPKRCRRCLLQDMADENDYYASVVRYRATMPRRVRTPDAEYTARLEHCRTCPSLNAGTCMQCGCYVEMRAARTDMHCPLDKAPW